MNGKMAEHPFVQCLDYTTTFEIWVIGFLGQIRMVKGDADTGAVCHRRDNKRPL